MITSFVANEALDNKCLINVYIKTCNSRKYMQSEAVIFDFDGVIINSEPIHYQACIKVLKNISITLSYTDYCRKYLGLSDKEMFPKILTDYGYDFFQEEAEQLLQDKIDAYIEILDNSTHLPLIDGINEYIMHLVQEKKKLAICTGSTRKEVLAVLSKMRKEMLTQYFQIIITAEDVNEGKPSPEGYLLTAKSLGVAPHDCSVIEDSPLGIKAAKAAGMTVIALETTYNRSQLHEADKIVASLTVL